MKLRNLIPTIAVTAVFTIVSGSVSAQPDSIERQEVQFARGAVGTIIPGRIVGRQTIDYIVRASAGQRISAKLTSGSSAVYFNLLPPTGATALYVGDGFPANDYVGRLPVTGAYRLRVYLNRAAARRGERADYSLALRIDPARPGAQTNAAERSCLAEVGKRTGTRGTSVIASRREGPRTIVDVGVRGAIAPWRCTVGPGGRVIDVMFMGDEGAL